MMLGYTTYVKWMMGQGMKSLRLTVACQLTGLMADKMFGGRLKIRIDSANKHKVPFDIFDMVKAGQYVIWAIPLPKQMKNQIPLTRKLHQNTPYRPAALLSHGLRHLK